MADKILTQLGTAAAVYYALFRKRSTGQVWNGAALVTYATANLATYAVASDTEQGTASRHYPFSVPALPGTEASPQTYQFLVFKRLGAAPAETDPLVWEETFSWDGTSILSLANVLADVGAGARTVTITVNDGTSVVEGATVRLTKGAETFTATTNVSGVAVFNADDGTWTVAITAAGYSFAGASLVVDGDEAVTYSLTATSVIPASSAAQTTGYLYAYDQEGLLESGVDIKCTVQEGAGHGLALDSTSRTETSAASGLVQFTGLFKGATYRFTRGISTRGTDVTIPTDADDTYELPDVIGRP